MEFEWDDAKRQRNIQVHGIDFADVIQIFDGYTITTEDKRFDYGEIRYLTLCIQIEKTTRFASFQHGRPQNMNKNDILLTKEGATIITGTDWERLVAMTDEEIDLSDVPELTEEQLQGMRPTAELIPALANRGKTRITIRLDDQIIAFFKQQAADHDANYQTLINAALHHFMVQQLQKDDLRIMIRQMVQEEVAKVYS